MPTSEKWHVLKVNHTLEFMAQKVDICHCLRDIINLKNCDIAPLNRENSFFTQILVRIRLHLFWTLRPKCDGTTLLHATHTAHIMQNHMCTTFIAEY